MSTTESIGQEPCTGPCRHGKYIGPNGLLQGRGALIRDSLTEGYVGAQFDDRFSGYGFGWHRFPKQEFTIDRDTQTNQTDVPSETRS
jgi:hypothetical protein